MLTRSKVPTLKPDQIGHQFVVYGDSCSGIAGAPHEASFRQVNAAIRALDQPPEFICFLGDEIMGLTTDADELRRQWQHFFAREMAWLDRDDIPLYHTTGNHTTYDPVSESVFRDVMAHLPPHGPDGLSFFLRLGDLLLVFVNTLNSGTGGEGTVSTEWLDAVLQRNWDARHKLVFGHHPVWVVNGYAGDYQRVIERDNGRRFWDALLRHDVLAYFCSHILAFDVQVQCRRIADLHRRRRNCSPHAARAGVLAFCAGSAGR